MIDKEFYNSEHYADSTYYEALCRIEQEQRLMSRDAFYKSMAWRRARQGYIDLRKSIDGGLCEVCHTELGKIVHHKIWLNDDNMTDVNIALNFNNFRYECMTCHNKEENPLSNNKKKRYYYDKYGNMIQKK